PASATVSKPASCRDPKIPRRFHHEVVTAIAVSRDLPAGWAGSPYIAKIVCWQDKGFSTTFFGRGPDHVWHGPFARTVQEMKSIQGPALGNDRDGLILNSSCFIHGWDACPRRAANARIVQQLIAGMRWIWWVYGHPVTAWRHVERTGRFNSYPRPG